MRMMMRVQIPVGRGNEAIKDGSLPRLMRETLDALKPEAAYFTTTEGQRTALIVFDMKDVAMMPKLAEPFFMRLDARVDLAPVMDAQDLERGLQQVRELTRTV
ncbi:MAG TPA: hypothetical protein VFD01_08645 [Candidatus Dormibacteraeota bacterium]|jgi:hypothetical protein|nr:hypothetical protein [Candidatus Dormibacteraeota bacterium]